MAGVAKKHLVDGRWTTVGEVAREMGLTHQQLYNQMSNRGISLQVTVNLIRENLVLNGQGKRAGRHFVEGRWMTVRQAAEMLGVSMTALYQWLRAHRHGDGSPAPLAEAVAAYREKRVVRGGSTAQQHRVGSRQMTVAEATAKCGVSVNAIRLHMHKRKASLAATIRYYEKRKLKKAEKDILAILMEGMT